MNKIEMRAEKIAQMKVISDKGADITDEEKRSFDALSTEVDQLSKEIEAEESQAKMNGFSTSTPAQKVADTEDAEERSAKDFVSTGRFEMRALLSTGTIAKPTKVGGINGLGEVGNSIVDDVKAVGPLSGIGAWREAYKATDAEAADVTDGSDIGGTEATFNYVDINPAEWGVYSELSNQVASLTPLAYKAEVEKSTLTALRAKAASKILANLASSTLTQAKVYLLDKDYIRNLVLGFDAIEGKGDVVLYISQADMLTLGKVRGANEKKALFDIEFDAGTTKSGVIKDGGTAVKFRILSGLTAGTQYFGQPQSIVMPMWGNYKVESDSSIGFKKNTLAIRGLQTAGVALAAKNGMQKITNVEATGDGE